MQKTTKQEVFSWIKSISVALIIAFLCRSFLFSPTTVHGESMKPTFQDKDRVMVSKISDIQRFDMIVFDAPDAPDDGKYYIKRVIGLPGDSIEVKDDVLYINGKATKEPYLKENKEETPFHKLTWDFTLKEVTGKSKVPEQFLFVMGDNRMNSNDSRFFGFVPYNSVFGEVKFQFYPIQHIGIPK